MKVVNDNTTFQYTTGKKIMMKLSNVKMYMQIR